MTEQIGQSIEKYDSISGFFAKNSWTFLGNAILLFTAVSIFPHKRETLHTADIVFQVAAIALITIRYFDIKFLNGLTVTGMPVSMTHREKYPRCPHMFSTYMSFCVHDKLFSHK